MKANPLILLICAVCTAAPAIAKEPTTMPYQPTWSNGTNARVVSGVHWAKASDVQEIAAGINRRFAYVYRAAEDYSNATGSGVRIGTALYDATNFPPYSNFQYALESLITAPAVGKYAGNPPSPTSMTWLWPYADADENKVIVNGFQGVGSGQVSLFNKLNGSSDWTDGILSSGVTRIKAVHLNEYRHALEILSRGRWVLPVYCSGGIFSAVPDESWASNMLYNYQGDELRCVAFVDFNGMGSPALGPTNITVRSSSKLSITASGNCSVSIYQCHQAIDFLHAPPSWDYVNTLTNTPWPGGSGAIGDSTLVGSISCTANVAANFTGSGAAQLFQLMANGGANNILLRRTDTNSEPVTITVSATIDFDLNSPPN